LAKEGDSMNLSLIQKMGMVFRYIFSSFLSIEMFVLSLLLFIILIVNLRRNNKIIQLAAIGVYLGFVIGIFISYTTYVQTCIDSFVKLFMNYVYFPSTVVYFFIMTFVSVMIIWTLFSTKLTTFKRIINYAFFSILYFFFMSFIALATYDGVDLLDTPTLYENDLILSLVQLSNFILVIWIVFTGFYWLFKYLKKRFD
jgi:hypothetical protein